MTKYITWHSLSILAGFLTSCLVSFDILAMLFAGSLMLALILLALDLVFALPRIGSSASYVIVYATILGAIGLFPILPF